MDLGKLQRSLYKEFTKSPLKTGTLLTLCAVALYYIVPLLLPEKKKDDGSNRAQILPSATSPEISGATETVKTAAAINWEQLVDWMKRDPRMASAELPPSIRNPFQMETLEIIDPEVQTEEELVRAEVTSEEVLERLGIVLSATVVGPRTRLATINGRTYREREMVSLGENDEVDEESAPRVDAFRLAEVGSSHVILVRNGREFRLALKRKRARGISIAGPGD